MAETEPADEFETKDIDEDAVVGESRPEEAFTNEHEVPVEQLEDEYWRGI